MPPGGLCSQPDDPKIYPAQEPWLRTAGAALGHEAAQHAGLRTVRQHGPELG